MKANRKRTDEKRKEKAKVGGDGSLGTDRCVDLRDRTGAKECNFISH